MNAFVIYAIVLTAIYVVYYAVVVPLDLFGKTSKEKSDVEIFNTTGVLGDGSGEDSVGVEDVEETPKYVKDEYEDQLKGKNGESQEQQPAVVSSGEVQKQQEAVVTEEEKAKKEDQTLYEKIQEERKEREEKTPPIVPEYLHETDDITFGLMLANMDNEEEEGLKIIRSMSPDMK